MNANAPCLRADLAIIPQVYGGETSFVVKDAAAQKYFRFGALEVRVMRCFDGRRTPAEITAALADEGLRISAQAVDAFARKMSVAGFLERTTAERSVLELERLRAERRMRRRPRLFRGELLRMRWSFGDPDSMLTRSLPRLRWMFTRSFAVASAAAFTLYLVILGSRWDEFTAALSATYSLHSITLANVVTLWITAGVVILIHELGHGYACKHFGGEVRELGFMLVYFQPAFYCNVSDAWSFPERRARLWVTAAGSWIQLVAASLAALVWWIAEPGTLAANVALAAMLIGGVTTLFTNANPLLPLDGYFALTDWLEIPNLRLRAFAHFQWWLKRNLLRLELPEPAASPRERRVFLIYGALAVAYAISLFALLAAISLGWASRTFGGLGLLLAVLLLLAMLWKRLTAWGRGAMLALRSHRAAVRRMRRPLMAVVVAVMVMLLVTPWTLTSGGAFVVRPRSTSVVSAPDSGVVAQLYVAEGTRVGAGAPLARLVNRALERELLAGSRVVDSLSAAEAVARANGRTGEASRLAARREAALSALAALQRRMDELTLRASVAGTVASARPEDLIGHRVQAGDSVLTLATLDTVELRIALSGAGATRVRAGQVVHFASFADLAAPWTARITDVSRVGVAAGGGPGVVEARARRVAGGAWRPGVTGEASVELERSNLLGALWWKARQMVRTDLLL